VILHREELELARTYTAAEVFHSLTREQVKKLGTCAARLDRWRRTHPRAHLLINIVVVSALIGADLWLLLAAPEMFAVTSSTARALTGALAIGIAHSYLLYSLVVFSLHEGAAHDLIIPPSGPITTLLGRITNNLCRLGGADPVYYARNHQSHHAHFGTELDGEFLNFVLPRRYWLTLLPFAMYAGIGDFVVHRPLRLTPSLRISLRISFLFHILCGAVMLERYGALFTLVTLLAVAPHMGFYVDRARQFTEHNLMPLDNRNGSRSFGTGFWGLFIGGGPWGQPCHLMHHLAPTLPWYAQLLLHQKFKRMLTPEPTDSGDWFSSVIPAVITQLWIPHVFRAFG
jgi:hypothetical protein